MTCFNTSRRLDWPSSVATEHPARHKITTHTDANTEQLPT